MNWQMELPKLKSIIEGLLFASGDEGLDLKTLAHVLELDGKFLAGILEEMKQAYESGDRGLVLLETAGSYKLGTKPELAPYLERFIAAPTRPQLSQAALETLSIIAYRQPITRVEIEEIRGVRSDRALQTLLARDLIEEVGRADTIGRPILYGTTKTFLDYFALNSLDDLPDVSSLEGDIDLEEETRMLYEKLEAKQLSFEDLPQIRE